MVPNESPKGSTLSGEDFDDSQRRMCPFVVVNSSSIVFGSVRFGSVRFGSVRLLAWSLPERSSRNGILHGVPVFVRSFVRSFIPCVRTNQPNLVSLSLVRSQPHVRRSQRRASRSE